MQSVHQSLNVDPEMSPHGPEVDPDATPDGVQIDPRQGAGWTPYGHQSAQRKHLTHKVRHCEMR